MAGRGCAVRAVAIFSIFQSNNFAVSWRHAVACVGSMWWRRQQIFQIFFFKFCNTMICCLGCANDGVAAMVVVAAEKFQKISKNFKNFQFFFYYYLITSQFCSAGGGKAVALLR